MKLLEKQLEIVLPTRRHNNKVFWCKSVVVQRSSLNDTQNNGRCSRFSSKLFYILIKIVQYHRIPTKLILAQRGRVTVKLHTRKT